MSATCLLQSEKDKLVAAIRSGDLDMGRLYDMSNDERAGVFEKVVGSDSAKLVNAEFEKAQITATKKAAADYFSVKDKPAAARLGTQAEFGTKLLSDSQKQTRLLKAFDDRIQKIKDLQTKNAESIRLATDPEQKANLQFKDTKYQGQIDRLGVRREDAANPVSNRLVNKINSISTLLGDDHYSDLASIKLGQDVTPAQGEYILKQAATVRDLSKAATEGKFQSDGSSNADAQAQYLNASKTLHNYIEGLKPVSAIGSVWRNLVHITTNFLLANPATPIKAVEAQVINASIEAMVRRIGSGFTNGVFDGANPELQSKALTYLQDITKKTGGNFNQASMENIDDSGKLGEKSNFEVAQGLDSKNPVVKGAEYLTRKANQISTTAVIDWAHNITFTKFYQRTMVSALDLYSTGLAKDEGLSGTELKSRAAEIFADGMDVEPKTDQGLQARARAQADAARVTSTNPTLLGDAALKLKNMINGRFPGLGDILAPIAKIPTTILTNAIINAGPGIPMGAYDIVVGLSKLGSDTLETHQEGLAQVTKGISTVARTAGVLAAAAYFTSQLTSKDFRTDAYGNQFVLIGGQWMNREYFNAVAPAIGGMMDIKANAKKGQSVVTTAAQYVAGAGQGLLSLPVIDEVNKARVDILNKSGKGTAPYFMGLLQSRDTPAFWEALTSDRPGNELLFGKTGIETPAEVKADNVAAAKKAAATKRAKNLP